MSSPGIKDFKVTCVFSIYSWPADSFPLNYDQNGLQFIDGDQVLMDNILKYGKMTNIVFKHDNGCFFDNPYLTKNQGCKAGNLVQNIPESQKVILNNNGISQDDLIGYFKANKWIANGDLSQYGSCLTIQGENVFNIISDQGGNNYIWVSPRTNKAFFINTGWFADDYKPLEDCPQQNLCLTVPNWGDTETKHCLKNGQKCCAGGFVCDKSQFCRSIDGTCSSQSPNKPYVPTPPSPPKPSPPQPNPPKPSSTSL